MKDLYKLNNQYVWGLLMKQTAAQKIEMPDDLSALVKSIRCAQEDQEPFRHWILRDLLTEETIKELIEVSYGENQLEYKVGTREENNSYRHYFDLESQKKYPVAQRVADTFQNPAVLNALTDLCGVQFKGHFLRIEYAEDQEGFWLHPHTDIGAKIFTLLFYLNEEPQPNMWGTDVYKDADHHTKRIPFEKNSALLFVPASNTWHGFEPRPMTGTRKTLIINFVKTEWRNRHELATIEPIS